MWEDGVRTVEPYVPGEQPRIANLIKLNTNENPYPPAPMVAEKLKTLSVSDFRKYPDPNCTVLVEAIADVYKVDKENIFVGVGSDDVISMAFLTFFNTTKPVLLADVTYSFYDVWAKLYRIPYESVPLKEDFTLDINDYMKENGGIVIANPNAPTGLALPLSSIETVVKANRDSVVIVDEAYVDFGSESAVKLIDKYENLLVVQTFSKSRSMAGIRIGYAFGSKKLIKYLSDVKFSFNSYTMNMPALELGAVEMRNQAYTNECVGKIIATRERTKAQLSALGFEYLDSKTNFIFAKHKTVPRDEIFSKLRENNILVRAFKDERIKDYLRISIGTDGEMQIVIDVLKKILGEI